MRVTGSDVIAAQDAQGVGANVILDAAEGTHQHIDTQESHSSGFTLGLSGSVGQALTSTQSEIQATNASQDSRATALHAIAAGASLANLATQSMANPEQKPSIGAQLSFGVSQSQSKFTENQTNQTGSNVQAGGTAAFVATGEGTPESGNGLQSHGARRAVGGQKPSQPRQHHQHGFDAQYQ